MAALATALPLGDPDAQALLDIEEGYEHHIVAALNAAHKNGKAKKNTAGGPVLELPVSKPKPEPVDHAAQIVAAATKKVWAKHDWKKEYDADAKNKHPHCRHCHAQCKSDTCRHWCHKKYCHEGYTGDVQLGKYTVGRLRAPGIGVMMTNRMKKAIEKTNDHLAHIDKAKHAATFRHAEESMEDYEMARHDDWAHFKREMERADDLNKAAYDSSHKRKEKRLLRQGLQELHMKTKKKRDQQFIVQSQKNRAKAKAEIESLKAESVVEKAMAGDSWDKSVSNMANLDTSFMKSSGKKSTAEPQTSATKVAAKLASVEVGIGNLKKEAQSESRQTGNLMKREGSRKDRRDDKRGRGRERTREKKGRDSERGGGQLE